MLGKIKWYGPSAALVLLDWALNLSGYQNPALAVGLAALAMFLLILPVWDSLRSYATRSSWRDGLADLSGEPLLALVGGSAFLTLFLSQGSVPPSTTNLGWLLIFLAVVFAYGVLWLAAGRVFSLQSMRQSSWPDYLKWDEKNVLRLFEAACLWNDEEPVLPMSRRAQETFKLLHKAIYAREMSTKFALEEVYDLPGDETSEYPKPNEDPVNVNTKVGRKQLRAFALSRSQRPRFLFADQRAN